MTIAVHSNATSKIIPKTKQMGICLRNFVRKWVLSTSVCRQKKKTLVRKTKVPMDKSKAFVRTNAMELIVLVPSPAWVTTAIPLASVMSPNKKSSVRVSIT